MTHVSALPIATLGDRLHELERMIDLMPESEQQTSAYRTICRALDIFANLGPLIETTLHEVPIEYEVSDIATDFVLRALGAKT